VDEQMVYSEATIAVPLIVGYGYHKGSWKARRGRKWNLELESAAVGAAR
jgi:deoxyhypusine synthase